MPSAGIFLDLNALINGGMDAFIIIITGKLLHYPLRKKRVFFGALAGEIPVILAVYGSPPWLMLSKVLIPFLMVGIAFAPQSIRSFGRILISFWLVSAGLGGFIYALWGLMEFDGWSGQTFFLRLTNLWFLPLGGVIWWLSQLLWLRWHNHRSHLDQVLYELEIDFGEAGQVLQVKGLLDTGNDLRDPLTGVPVLLLEEQVASTAIPQEIQDFLKLPWREVGDPWPLIWQANPLWLKHLVFVPCKGIGGESWLLGIRPEKVNLVEGANRIPIKATVALVQQVLSNEGEYQALLHQDHVLKGAACS